MHCIGQLLLETSRAAVPHFLTEKHFDTFLDKQSYARTQA